MADYTYFAESLSAEEYPSIDITSVSATFGVSAYSAADGDKVSLKSNDKKEVVAEVVTKYGDIITLTVERRTTLARFTLKVKESTQKARTIAYGICQKGILLSK